MVKLHFKTRPLTNVGWPLNLSRMWFVLWVPLSRNLTEESHNKALSCRIALTLFEGASRKATMEKIDFSSFVSVNYFERGQAFIIGRFQAQEYPITISQSNIQFHGVLQISNWFPAVSWVHLCCCARMENQSFIQSGT